MATKIMKMAAAVLLPLILWVALQSCVLPSSASRIIRPKSDNDAPTNVSNHQNLPKRGTNNAVVVPQASNNSKASLLDDCDYICNDHQCRFYYPWLCWRQDGDCHVGCDCSQQPYECQCLCNS